MFDDALDDRQSEARARNLRDILGIASIEPRKHFRQILRRYPDARVAHGHEYFHVGAAGPRARQNRHLREVRDVRECWSPAFATRATPSTRSRTWIDRSRRAGQVLPLSARMPLSRRPRTLFVPSRPRDARPRAAVRRL